MADTPTATPTAAAEPAPEPAAAPVGGTTAAQPATVTGNGTQATPAVAAEPSAAGADGEATSASAPTAQDPGATETTAAAAAAAASDGGEPSAPAAGDDVPAEGGAGEGDVSVGDAEAEVVSADAAAVADKEATADAAPPQEEAAVATPPQEEAAVATPPQEEAAVAAPPEEEAAVAAPPEEEAAVAAPPEEEAALAAPPQGEAAVAAPSSPQNSASPEAEPSAAAAAAAADEGAAVAAAADGEDAATAAVAAAEEPEAGTSATAPPPLAVPSAETTGAAIWSNVFGSSESESDSEGFEGFDEAEIQAAPEPVAPAAKEKAARKTKQQRRKRRESSEAATGRAAGVGEDSGDELAGSSAKKEDPNDPFRKKAKKQKMGDDVGLDDKCLKVLNAMEKARLADDKSNVDRKPALQKLKILPQVYSNLRKADLRVIFVENGVYKALADWLRPMPDGSLVNEKIRTAMIDVINSLPAITRDDIELLEESQIGRVCMHLLKHKREVKKNKIILRKVLERWNRAILNRPADFSGMDDEAKMDRAMAASSERTRQSDSNSNEWMTAHKHAAKLRPGEEGFIMRARLPPVTSRDYTVRPQSLVAREIDPDQKTVHKRSRYEQMKNSFKNSQRSLQKGHMRINSVNMSGSFSQAR